MVHSQSLGWCLINKQHLTYVLGTRVGSLCIRCIMYKHLTTDEAAAGVMCRLEHSQRKIVLQSIHGQVFILQSIIGHMVQ
jgi:hypothetical protein